MQQPAAIPRAAVKHVSGLHLRMRYQMDVFVSEKSADVSAPLQGPSPAEVEGEAEILLAFCCGCIDGTPPCVYCALRKKGTLNVRKFRQVPGKVYGNYTMEEGSANQLCEVTYSTFRIHGASGSIPLVSLLDPMVELLHPPAGVKDLCTFSICCRGPSNVNDIWYMRARLDPTQRCNTFTGTSPPQPKQKPPAGSRCSNPPVPSARLPHVFTTCASSAS